MKRAVSFVYEVSVDDTPLWPEKDDYTISKSGNYIVITLHDKWVQQGFKVLRVDEALRSGEDVIRVRIEAQGLMHLKDIAFRI